MSEQIDLLANFIMAEVEGEPSQSEGAGDCAIRIIKQLEEKVRRLKRIVEVNAPDVDIEYNLNALKGSE